MPVDPLESPVMVDEPPVWPLAAPLLALEVTKEEEPLGLAEPEVGPAGAVVMPAGMEAAPPGGVLMPAGMEAASCWDVFAAGCEVTGEGWPVTTPSELV